MRLGILGGTFDPVHIGHLIIAQEAAAVLGLDEVWFLPTGRPWMKEGSAVTDSGHRVAMLRLALECSAGFKVSTAEVDRPGLSYTVDTLTALLEGEAMGASLFFILGMDSLETLHRWKEPHRLFDMCTLVAMSRPGHVDFDRTTLDGIRPNAAEEVVFLEGPDIGISGAEIRRRAQQGLPITYWTPLAVAQYIREHGLYQEADIEQ